MKEKISDLKKKVITIENIINDLFTGIFKFRNRDKSEIIRSLCLKYLGEWMIEYPDVFISDYYLRYLGWALSDEKFKVRLNALISIENILESDHADKIESFVKYFEKRLVSMLKDVHPSVTISAIRVASHLVKSSFLPF